MFNTIKKCFGPEDINTGLQWELNMAKGFAIVFMIWTHVFEQLSSQLEGIGVTLVRNILGGPFAAPVFMICLGIGISYSRKNMPVDLLKRGLIRGTMELYSTLKDTNPSKLVVDAGYYEGYSPYWVYFGEDEEKVLEKYGIEMLRFYDHYLKGIKNGIDIEPPILIYNMNGDGWRAENEWPQYNPNVFADGNAVHLTVDLLPTSWVFKEGHSIRVSIACADWPTLEILPELSPTNDPADPNNIVPVITVFRDDDHPSNILLPIVPK